MFLRLLGIPNTKEMKVPDGGQAVPVQCQNDTTNDDVLDDVVMVEWLWFLQFWRVADCLRGFYVDSVHNPTSFTIVTRTSTQSRVGV